MKRKAPSAREDALRAVEIAERLHNDIDTADDRAWLVGFLQVDYQPPAPSPDHEWNPGSKRWQLSQAASERQAKRESARAQIAALRDSQHDHVRALLLDSTNAGARKRLQEIEAEIAGLRAQLV